MTKINNIYESILNKEGNYFSLSINPDSGIPIVTEGTPNNNIGFGALEILEYEVVPSSDSPFNMFSRYDALFEKTKETFTNDILGVKPVIEASINEGSRMLLSSKLINLASFDSLIASWYDEEEEYTYILIQSLSDEEGSFGYIGMILFCRLEND